MSPQEAKSRLTLILALSALALTGVALWPRHPSGPVAGPGIGGFQKGMVLGLFSLDDPGRIERQIEELEGLGVSSVALVVPWSIPDVRSLEMRPRADLTPTDAALRTAIRAAHERGMTALLMPILYVEDVGEGRWRGTLDPPGWTPWFAAYGRFILRYAELAGQEGAEYFIVGSELGSTEGRRAEWLDLIGKVRGVYSGRISYSANWDRPDLVSFADALDVLGMNAYHELSPVPGAPEEALVEAWGPIREAIGRWASRWGKRILFTEIGYPSRPGASVDPWNSQGGDEPDLEAQRRCYRAFRRAWGGEPVLEGVYFYIWWGDGGPADTGYTPRGKPAAEEIRRWYRGEERRQR